MDPTVEAALVGVGGALVGFVASAWQNSVSMRTQRRIAVEQRIWEKRSAVYERVLDAVIDPESDPAVVLTAINVEEGKVFGYGSPEVKGRFADLQRACVRDMRDPRERLYQRESMGRLADAISGELQAEPRPARSLIRGMRLLRLRASHAWTMVIVRWFRFKEFRRRLWRKLSQRGGSTRE